MKDEETKRPGSYNGYEYREISVPEWLSSLCIDSYPCFGWEPDPNRNESKEKSGLTGLQKGHGNMNMTRLYFRRSRNLCNKAELTRLQRNFDSCVSELEALRRSKNSAATIAALVIGILGTAFLAGATFASVADPPVIWLAILLAVPGFLGWILPYFVYRKLVQKKTKEIEPLMEQKYDEIEAVCRKGLDLLH